MRPSGAGVLARRSAVARLGGAPRRLTDAAVRTTVEVPGLERVAAAAADLEAALRARQTGATDVPAVDDLGGTVRMYNPTFGAGNPGAPPLTLHPPADGSMLGTCTLGPALEGPHTFAAEGALTTAADDDESTVLVEARGLFIRLRPGQAEQLARSAPHPGPSRD